MFLSHDFWKKFLWYIFQVSMIAWYGKRQTRIKSLNSKLKMLNRRNVFRKKRDAQCDDDSYPHAEHWARWMPTNQHKWFRLNLNIFQIHVQYRVLTFSDSKNSYKCEFLSFWIHFQNKARKKKKLYDVVNKLKNICLECAPIRQIQFHRRQRKRKRKYTYIRHIWYIITEQNSFIPRITKNVHSIWIRKQVKSIEAWKGFYSKLIKQLNTEYGILVFMFLHTTHDSLTVECCDSINKVYEVKVKTV